MTQLETDLQSFTEALAYVHHLGIVHRDVKCATWLFSGLETFSGSEKKRKNLKKQKPTGADCFTLTGKQRKILSEISQENILLDGNRAVLSDFGTLAASKMTDRWQQLIRRSCDKGFLERLCQTLVSETKARVYGL